MPRLILALVLALALPSHVAAQLDEPEGSCFEPVKPACAEVTVNAEDEGWALRCREELVGFLEDLERYEQCVNSRIDQMRRQAEGERERMNCLAESEDGAEC